MLCRALDVNGFFGVWHALYVDDEYGDEYIMYLKFAYYYLQRKRKLSFNEGRESSHVGWVSLNYHEIYSCVCFLITVISFFMLFVSGNAVLLALSTVLHHLYKDFRHQCNISGFLKPVNYLCIFIAVETTILAYVIVMYICKLHSI
jgi:hypothetical protein